MPDDRAFDRTRPITRSMLVRDLEALGVRPGGVVMVHTRMSAIGWVVGGADAIVLSLLDLLGPPDGSGTLMAYAGWEDNPWHMPDWPDEWRSAYRDELPAFDPAVSSATRDVGRIPERIRTWPGARRSSHPEANVVAIGPRAGWLVEPHPDDFPQGQGSPLARLVEASGQVLMLGAPLETITLLHHAEHLADGRGKRYISRSMPALRDGRRRWIVYRDIDTSSRGAFPYEEVLGPGADPFEVIGTAAIDAGVGRWGAVGDARSAVFDAAALVDFGVRWIEERFRASA